MVLVLWEIQNDQLPDDRQNIKNLHESKMLDLSVSIFWFISNIFFLHIFQLFYIERRFIGSIGEKNIRSSWKLTYTKSYAFQLWGNTETGDLPFCFPSLIPHLVCGFLLFLPPLRQKGKKMDVCEGRRIRCLKPDIYCYFLRNSSV